MEPEPKLNNFCSATLTYRSHLDVKKSNNLISAQKLAFMIYLGGIKTTCFIVPALGAKSGEVNLLEALLLLADFALPLVAFLRYLN